MFTSLLKDMVKDTDEQPDEEMNKVRSGRVLWTGAFVPIEFGCVIFLEGLFLPTWKLSEPGTLGILRRQLLVAVTDHYVHFQLLSPLWRSRG